MSVDAFTLKPGDLVRIDFATFAGERVARVESVDGHRVTVSGWSDQGLRQTGLIPDDRILRVLKPGEFVDDDLVRTVDGVKVHCTTAEAAEQRQGDT